MAAEAEVIHKGTALRCNCSPVGNKGTHGDCTGAAEALPAVAPPSCPPLSFSAVHQRQRSRTRRQEERLRPLPTVGHCRTLPDRHSDDWLLAVLEVPEVGLAAVHRRHLRSGHALLNPGHRHSGDGRSMLVARQLDNGSAACPRKRRLRGDGEEEDPALGGRQEPRLARLARACPFHCGPALALRYLPAHQCLGTSGDDGAVEVLVGEDHLAGGPWRGVAAGKQLGAALAECKAAHAIEVGLLLPVEAATCPHVLLAAGVEQALDIGPHGGGRTPLLAPLHHLLHSLLLLLLLSQLPRPLLPLPLIICTSSWAFHSSPSTALKGATLIHRHD
mmetsp:Transcript_20195/g.77323  ORF Transcript_20195/g.77323 Transcript_20195/m.77323 type:complete len:332 (+) Transcript_20195:1831-2826(+)